MFEFFRKLRKKREPSASVPIAGKARSKVTQGSAEEVKSAPALEFGPHVPGLVEETPEIAAFLDTELEPLKMKFRLPGKVRNYILTGEDGGVLQDMAALKGLGREMALADCPDVPESIRKYRRARWAFYGKDLDWSPLFLYRMAQVYQAGAARDQKREHHWLARFLIEIRAIPSLNDSNWRSQFRFPLVPVLGMLELAGESRELLASLALPGVGRDMGEIHLTIGARLTGFADLARGYTEEIREVLHHGGFRERFYMAFLLEQRMVDPDPFREDILALLHRELENEHSFPRSSWIELYNMRLFSWKDTEENREFHRGKFLESLLPIIYPILVRDSLFGERERRLETLEELERSRSRDSPFLKRWGFPGHRPFMRPRQLYQYLYFHDPDPGIREMVRGFLGKMEVPESLSHLEELRERSPPSRKLSPGTPLAPEPAKLLEELLRAYDDYMVTEIKGKKAKEPEYRLGEEGIRVVLSSFREGDKLLGARVIMGPAQGDRWQKFLREEGIGTLCQLARHPEFTLEQLVRFHTLFDLPRSIVERSGYSCGWDLRLQVSLFYAASQVSPFWRSLDSFREGHGGFLDFREVAKEFQLLGVNSDFPGQLVFWGNFRVESSNVRILDTSWSPEEIRPYFEERFQFQEAPRIHGEALEILKLFPRPPSLLLPYLWDLALEGKAFNREARSNLEKLPDIREQLCWRLSSGPTIQRINAAGWLVELKAAEAVGPMRKALKEEKDEAVRVTFMDALVALGVPVEEVLDIKGLLLEAGREMRKGIPEMLDWFDFKNLPGVRWRDGSEVPRELLVWFIVRSCSRREPAPTRIMKYHCSRFHEGDREAFGNYVLGSWLTLDTRPKYGPKEEEEAIRELVKERFRYWKHTPEAEEEYRRGILAHRERVHLLDSAMSEKGVLAVAGACCGDDAARLVKDYLHRYYGWRAPQCKALLAMLAWVDGYEGVNLLFSIAEHFRTKGIKDVAGKQVKLLARRMGWDLEELGDRSLSSGGFDGNHELVLDFGPRKFMAQLTPELKIELTREDGSSLKSLPDPVEKDDKELAEAAKKDLAAAKRALRGVKKQGKARLLDAMATGRSWRFEDWGRFLNRHPIMGFLCQRVVWELYQNGESKRALASFRPLEDGSLTTVGEEELQPGVGTLVKVAHATTLGAEGVKNWKKHLKDYSISPLLSQFPGSFYTLAEAKKEDTDISDFRGYVVDGQELDRLARRLGYNRGPQEGAWFESYLKTSVSAGLEFHILFTGSSFGIMDKDVALKELVVLRLLREGEDPWNRDKRKIPLGKVPPILLSGAWEEMKKMADTGTGFDPNWEEEFR